MQWQFYVPWSQLPVPAVKTRMLAAVYVATNTCSTVTYGIFNLAWAGLKTFRISLLDRQMALSAPAVPYLPGSESTCKRFTRFIQLKVPLMCGSVLWTNAGSSRWRNPLREVNCAGGTAGTWVICCNCSRHGEPISHRRKHSCNSCCVGVNASFCVNFQEVIFQGVLSVILSSDCNNGRSEMTFSVHVC